MTQYVFDVYNQLTAEQWLSGGDPVPEIDISTTTQGGTVDEVQRVGVTSMYLGGTFTLTFDG